MIPEMFQGPPLKLLYLSLCDENYVKEGKKRFSSRFIIYAKRKEIATSQ
jgi:hypothetical protein